MRFLLVGAAVVAATWSATAAASTCMVSAAQVLVKDSGFVRPLPEMVGFPLPVEVDASTGAFHVDFSLMPIGTFDISGVANALDVTAVGAVTGSIDASGNVSLPPIPITFTTDLLPGQPLTAMEFLTTGIEAVTLAGTDYATIGIPLDFTSGVLHIEGQGLVHNAPVVGTSTSGFTLTCTLSPIPAQSSLPAAPTLAAHGTGKPGKAAAGTLVGDSLVVKAKMKNGKTPLDPTQDVFVRIANGDTELVLLRAVAGTLTQKGKKLSGSDTDGSVIHVVTGRKSDGTNHAPVAGSLVIAQSKKGLTLTAKESGVDLSQLATATNVTVTISLGPQTAADTATVKASAKKVVLK